MNPPAAPPRLAGVVTLGVLLAVVAGFARSYYFKAWFDGPALTALVHWHGLTLTGWLALFAAQVALVRLGRVHWHRRLGWVALAWVVMTIGVAVATAITAARLGRSPVPAVPPLVFLAIPLGDAAVFGTLVLAGIALRGRPDWHRRLMLLSGLALLPPALGRLPFAICHTPLGFMGLTDLAIATVAAADAALSRRLHPAWVCGGLLMLVSQPLRLAIAQTAAWRQFAVWLTQ